MVHKKKKERVRGPDGHQKRRLNQRDFTESVWTGLSGTSVLIQPLRDGVAGLGGGRAIVSSSALSPARTVTAWLRPPHLTVSAPLSPRGSQVGRGGWRRVRPHLGGR